MVVWVVVVEVLEVVVVVPLELLLLELLVLVTSPGVVLSPAKHYELTNRVKETNHVDPRLINPSLLLRVKAVQDFVHLSTKPTMGKSRATFVGNWF